METPNQLNEIPITLFKKIAMKYPRQNRDDLVQDMSLLYIGLPLEKQTPQYVNSVFALRCNDFIQQYSNPLNDSLDDFVIGLDCGLTTRADILESGEDVEDKIITADYINHLKLTQEEALIQKLFYIDGYSVKEIIELYSQQTFVTSEKTIYKILKKGQ